MTRFIPLDVIYQIILVLVIISLIVMLGMHFTRKKLLTYLKNNHNKLYKELSEPGVSWWKADFRKSTFRSHWKFVFNRIELKDEKYLIYLRNFRIAWLLVVIWWFCIVLFGLWFYDII